MLALAGFALTLGATLLLNRAAPGQWSVGAAGPGATPIPAQTLDLLLLYGGGLLLFAAALRTGGGAQPPFRIGTGGPAAMPRLQLLHRAGWVLLSAAAALSVAAAVRFTQLAPAPGAWSLHVGALLALLVGGALLSLQAAPAPGPPRRSARGWLAPAAMLALMLAALLLRVVGNGSYPFGIWFDEAANALVARKLLAGAALPGGGVPLYLPETFHTAHYNFLVAAAFWLLGDSIGSARWVSALLGVLLVPAAWLTAHELFRGAGSSPARTDGDRAASGDENEDDGVGAAMGWLAALLVVGLAWSLNLSRIAVNYNATPLFAVAAVGLLLLALRTQSRAAWLSTGLVLGLGLNFYSSFRLFLPVLPLGVAAALLAGRRTGVPLRQAWAASWRGLLIAGLAAAVVCAPLLGFAIAQPERVLERSSDTFIFSHAQAGERAALLWQNVRTHLAMFNVRGDANGRHNLPSRPMLDPVLGALFLLGAPLCLWRLREPRALLLLLWLAFTLLGGILTLAFEAPQSLRANGALPAALFIALLPVAALLRLASSRKAITRAAPLRLQHAAPALALLATPVLLWNLVGYFHDQRTDFATWNSFSAPETLIGQTLATVDPATADGWFIVTSANHPTIEYLAPQWAGRQRPLLATDPMPMRWPGGRAQWIFLSSENAGQLEQLRRLYPGAQVVENQPPFGGAVTSVHILLTAADVAAARGLTLNYAAGVLDAAGWQTPTAVEALPVQQSEQVQEVGARWTAAAATEPFVAHWQGALRTSFGVHTFTLQAPARAALWLDETLVLSHTAGAGASGPVSTTLTLADGAHHLRLVAEGASGEVALRWIPPAPPEDPAARLPADVPLLAAPAPIPAEALLLEPAAASGLLGSMAPLPEMDASTSLLSAATAALAAGPPVYQLLSPRIDATFHVAPVEPPVAVEWVGSLAVPVTGEYLLRLTATDAARLTLDGEFLAQTVRAGMGAEALRLLDAGLHDIEILFAARGPQQSVKLEWTPPGGERGVVPGALLLPPQGDPAAAAARLRATAAALLAPSGEFAQDAQQATGAAQSLAPQQLAAGLEQPTSVAVGADGRLYVTESAAGRLRILNPDGSDAAQVTYAAGALVEPFAVAAAPDGTLLLLDAARPALLRLDADGTLLAELEVPAPYLERSRGLAVDADGRIWLANTSGGLVVLLEADGTLVREWSAGSDAATTAQPVALLARPGRGTAGDPKGAQSMPATVAVVVLGSNEALLYDVEGARLASWPVAEANSLQGPHLAAGPNGTILLTVPERSQIEQRATDGSLLATWQLPTQPRIKPVGIAATPDGAYVLTDTDSGALWRVVLP